MQCQCLIIIMISSPRGYNSLAITRGSRMASTMDRPRDGEAENLAGSPIWNLQAGEDILPANNIIRKC